MSAALSWRATPNYRLTPGQSPRANASPISPSKRSPELAPEESRFQFKKVIGTTTRSPNAFDTDFGDTIVYCAGPAAILSQFDADLNQSQRLFRARPNARPTNATQSFYNPSTPTNTPTKNRNGSPLKVMGLGWGSNPALDQSLDFPVHGGGNARNREATCVSLNLQANLLAVGETGYNPRVLLFSTKRDAKPDVPLSILTDHSFGVSSVAISKDARWLCTLGNSYDGFILIYAINPTTGSARLQFSNKISNADIVFWMGSNVISIGTRHVKVWRLEQPASKSPSKLRTEVDVKSFTVPGSPTPKRFLGRNSILGSLIDSNFVHGIALSPCTAVLCTLQGEICVLDDTHQLQQVKVSAKVDFRVFCITCDLQNGLVCLAGEDGIMKLIALDELITRAASPECRPSSSGRRSLISTSAISQDILAIGAVRNHFVTLTATSVAIGAAEDDLGTSILSNKAKKWPSHGASVLGIVDLSPECDRYGADFATFSKDGIVLFWKFDGSCTSNLEIPLDIPNDVESLDSNEVVSLTPLLSQSCIVTGDKCGILRVTHHSGDSSGAVQAHVGEINGLAIGKQGGSTVIASCGRDRTVQIFHKSDSDLEVVQTLDDHTASVLDLMFSDDALTILSMSSDRTISIRRWACGDQGPGAYVPFRIITLKTSPVSFSNVAHEPDVVVVSTMDRQIQRYEISSGRLVHISKILDSANNESMLMNSISVEDLDGTEVRTRALLGISSTDRTIRIHDYESGILAGRAHGQNAISAVKLFQRSEEVGRHQQYVVSCGFDSTVIIWGINSLDRPDSTTSTISNGETPAINLPRRRILSKAETSNLQRSLESDSDTLTSLRDPSPTRIRRQLSRPSLSTTVKTSKNPPIAVSPDSNHDHRSSQHGLTQGVIPRNTSKLKRRQSKSAANLNNLNDMAKTITDSLYEFRNRVSSAAVDKLEMTTVQQLESELKLTTHALREKTQLSSGTMAGDLFDDYLAKMIDERLTLRAKSHGDGNVVGTAETPDLSPTSATAGAKDVGSNADYMMQHVGK